MNGSYQRSVFDELAQRSAVRGGAADRGREDDCTKTLGLGCPRFPARLPWLFDAHFDPLRVRTLAKEAAQPERSCPRS
jgi:hypothetical protein